MSLIYGFLVALIQISLCSSPTTDTFTFGTDEGRVGFTTSGQIGIFEKVVRIPIIVPQCEVLSFVRVDVDNKLGPPKVDLDTDMNTVVIEYRILQFSISSYTVTAKTVSDPKCNNKGYDEPYTQEIE